MTYHAKVIAGGKIVIPAEVRREMGIEDGDTLVLDRDADGALTIRTYRQVVRDVQRRFRAAVGEGGSNMIDELFAERRREAALEDQRLKDWAAGRR